MRRVIGIVDAFSSGQHLPPALRGSGCDCLHIQSSPTPPSGLAGSFRPANFIDNIIHTGNLAETAECLRKFSLSDVVPGCELGVRLARELGSALNLFDVGTNGIDPLRSKYAQTEAVRGAGLKATVQELFDNADDAKTWARKKGLTEVVIKPNESAGTDSIFVLSVDDDWSPAFAAIVGTLNKLGIPNDTALVQEVLKGTEYVVDLVTVGPGNVAVACVWKYLKGPANCAPFVYHAMELLPFEGEAQARVIDYGMKALEAIDPGHPKPRSAHLEIMDGPPPTLVEGGIRLHGGQGPLIGAKARGGYGQIDMFADALADAEKFKEQCGKPYTLKATAREVFLISRVEKDFDGLKRLDEVRALPTFYDMSIKLKTGDRLRKTVDHFTCPGTVVLMGQPKDVERDYNTIRDIEQGGMYD